MRANPFSRTPGERFRFSWPLLLLIASIAAISFAAYQAQTAVRFHQRTANRLLHDYSAFAAWSYQQHLSSQLQESAWEALHPFYPRMDAPMEAGMHAMPGPLLPASHIKEMYDEFFEKCNCKPRARPATYFAFTLGADTTGIAGWPVDDAVRRWLPDTILQHARTEFPSRQSAAFLMGIVNQHTYLLSYTLLPRTAQDTIVYGFIYNGAALDSMFRKVLDDKSLLPASLTHGLTNDTILSVAIVSRPYNATLFVHGWNCNCKGRKPAVLRGTYADDSLPAGFAHLFVRADVRPAIANQLIIGGLPSSRLEYLIGLLVLAGGLAIVAVTQLRRANDLARLRAEFVASVSHELRTPLAQIRLFIETLRLGRADSNKERDWALGNIDRETTRLSHLVENVLHFAGSDRGNAQLPEPHVLDIGIELQQIIDAFEPLADSRRAHIVANIPTGLHVPLRRDAFRQVMLNLLDNAIKYGPKGQTVRVELSSDEAPARARIVVSDEGPGVPQSEREAIWQPFYRGTSSSVRAMGGSGIGLPIVREIVEQHGGRAWVEAAAPTAVGGAAFVIELPLSAVHDDTHAEPTSLANRSA